MIAVFSHINTFLPTVKSITSDIATELICDFTPYQHRFGQLLALQLEAEFPGMRSSGDIVHVHRSPSHLRQICHLASRLLRRHLVQCLRQVIMRLISSCCSRPGLRFTILPRRCHHTSANSQQLENLSCPLLVLNVCHLCSEYASDLVLSGAIDASATEPGEDGDDWRHFHDSMRFIQATGTA